MFHKILGFLEVVDRCSDAMGSRMEELDRIIAEKNRIQGWMKDHVIESHQSLKSNLPDDMNHPDSVMLQELVDGFNKLFQMNHPASFYAEIWNKK